ncbi:TIGR03016 family PEP-CTERM system-associated outer membrane protein [Propionivibrio sp.]|uniref:TIGR03016 family PEP-CTERM system-associated outer membrane protein n=1 Tax=Propionivibrio sp. TaxID=2212460 RepID=UPI0025E732F0|nr:TIGR03016 family PEP-CTERM system-associated outer membrane protein [Propionivibrio sp.]
MLLGLILSSVALQVVAGDWKITPTIAVNETATDNVALDKTNKNDLISDISPGIRIAGSGGRSKLNVDYQLHDLIYARDSSRNNTQNSLNAQGTLEALENWLFIDASGVISQQSISAFRGATSTSVNTSTNNNTTETSTYRISPYFRGSFGSLADYQLRYNRSTTNTKSGPSFDSDTSEWIGSLKGKTVLASLGWTLDASSQTVKFSDGRKNEADRLRGVLSYEVTPAVRLSLIAGREANDYLTTSKQSHTTKGFGLDWEPSNRTKISASREDRFFGKSNYFNLTHRTAGTAWKYSESKDATVLPTQQASAGLGTFYDLALNICSSILPPGSTAAQQAACATALLGPIPPNNLVPGGFLSSGVTLQKRRDLSFALVGVRNTVTFAATQTESQSLSQSVGSDFLAGEDFSQSTDIRQRGGSVNWSHKLTPMSSLTGTFSRMTSSGTGGSSTMETIQKVMTLNFTTKLGPNTNAGLGARHMVSDGTSSYTESALTGMLSHQF